jgi:hypothetical protein
LVGHQLETLPAIAEAAGAGELGWSKLRLLARVAEPASETKWLDLAQEMSVGQLARVVGAYRRASDADDPDRSENQRQRRGIWLFDEPDGLVRVTGLLEPDDAAVLRAALVARGKRLWRYDRRNPDADAPEEPPDRGAGAALGGGSDVGDAGSGGVAAGRCAGRVGPRRAGRRRRARRRRRSRRGPGRGRPRRVEPGLRGRSLPDP